MPRKAIVIREEVYEQLKARKRDDESFSDLVDRLLAETTPDWREGFGTLPEEDGGELNTLVTDLRDAASRGLVARSVEACERASEATDDDEAS